MTKQKRRGSETDAGREIHWRKNEEEEEERSKEKGLCRVLEEFSWFLLHFQENEEARAKFLFLTRGERAREYSRNTLKKFSCEIYGRIWCKIY